MRLYVGIEDVDQLAQAVSGFGKWSCLASNLWFWRLGNGTKAQFIEHLLLTRWWYSCCLILELSVFLCFSDYKGKDTDIEYLIEYYAILNHSIRIQSWFRLNLKTIASSLLCFLLMLVSSGFARVSDIQIQSAYNVETAFILHQNQNPPFGNVASWSQVQ